MKVLAALSGMLRRPSMGDDFWSNVEDALIEADVGAQVTSKLIDMVKGERTPEAVKSGLARHMVGLFPVGDGVEDLGFARPIPLVVLVVGVNGVGKTTTIAKLARRHIDDGKRVLLVAADTFRAAAVDQLRAWGDRLRCGVVAQREGADAAAVAFDGVEKAKAKGFDVVIIDTAGRLHTKRNLMEELRKISRVIGRAMPGAPHERLLILDATVGSNGLSQAREFNDALGLTGIIVTKLDGTAKGGIVLAVAGELHIPITHIGVGEAMDDLHPFDPSEFVRAMLP